MRHQMMYRYGFPCLGTIIKIFASGIRDAEFLLFLKLHDRGGSELLGDGAEAELLVRRVRNIEFDIGHSISLLQNELSAFCHQSSPHEPLLAGGGCEHLIQFGFNVLRVSRESQQDKGYNRMDSGHEADHRTPK